MSTARLLDLVLASAGSPAGRPRIIAIDGRAASGTSTLAERLRLLAPRSAVVHTDDLAWHEPLFDWGHLLADDVLRPLHRGAGVCYRPPQWVRRGREGAIAVPAGLDVVLVEGTGASQRAYVDLVDATVWVQADVAEAERRGIARDIADGVNGDPQQTVAFCRDWMTAEMPFLERERPWTCACLIVNGTPAAPLVADHVEVAPALT